MGRLADELAQEAARFLRDTYLPRLERALETLPPADLWWQPHDGSLAVGTILRHLEGNLRQWIVSGLGGGPDTRDRAGEFASGERPDAARLMGALDGTLREACALIERLGEEGLARSYPIQGAQVTGLYAVLHVVEHFSWHTGQVVWIAKARAGVAHGLAFHDDQQVNAARNG